MVANANELLEKLKVLNDRPGPAFKMKNDPRITRVGKWLRRWSLDEIPQLFNVLMSHMSLVGPRPDQVDQLRYYTEAEKRKLCVKPGITGLAQVKGYHGPTVDYESIFTRYHWDAEYIRNASFWLDLRIIFLTFFQTLGNMIYILFSVFAKM